MHLTTRTGEFRLCDQVVKPVVGVMQNGNLYSSRLPRRIVNVKQYKLPGGGHNEINTTIKELENAGVIRPAQSPFNSLVWPVRKSNGSW